VCQSLRRETAEHEVGTRLKRNVVALLGRQREIFKMGLAVMARIYPYDHARTPSHREIIVQASLSEDEGVVSEFDWDLAHDGLDLAIVARAAIAREEIVNRCTIFEVAFAHSLRSGLSGPSRWPSVRDVTLSHSRTPKPLLSRVTSRPVNFPRGDR
jgi:hypothetical protein